MNADLCENLFIHWAAIYQAAQEYRQALTGNTDARAFVRVKKEEVKDYEKSSAGQK